jgi:hypothetical protein
MSNPQVFQFEGILEEVPNATGKSLAVEFPHNVEQLFGQRGSVRVIAVFNGVQARRALLPRGDGTHFLMLGGDLRRKSKAHPGMRMQVELWLDPEPDAIDVPEELEAALELEPAGRAGFERLTPSMKRNVCIYIEQAKTPTTRAKRAAFLLERFITGYYDNPNRDKTKV